MKNFILSSLINSTVASILWWIANGVLLLSAHHISDTIVEPKGLILGIIQIAAVIIVISAILIIVGVFLCKTENHAYDFCTLFPIQLITIFILSVVFSADEIISGFLGWLDILIYPKYSPIDNVLEHSLLLSLSKFIGFLFPFLMMFIGMIIKKKDKQHKRNFWRKT